MKEGVYDTKMQEQSLNHSLRSRARQCLLLTDPEAKVEATFQTFAALSAGDLPVHDTMWVDRWCQAGTPERPERVPSYRLPKRRMGAPEGHAALMHAFAHIEFNAINIAWDAVYRFNGMPVQFYADWARIAKEEAHHFQLINDYLKALGLDYGSFPAHDELWQMVEKTAHDVLVRMALVPRVLEARGLDVTPDIIKKFKHHGYGKAAEIMAIIYQDEIGHVRTGTHWFQFVCHRRRLEPVATFRQLLEEYAGDKIRQPFNEIARKKAGFSHKEMELLNQWPC